MMIDRDQALALISAATPLKDTETVSLSEAVGRVLAAPVKAALTQPPASMSAMDGYAVRFADCSDGASFKMIGEAAAGKPFQGSVSASEAVRIFTGSVVPQGADHIVIQEDTTRSDDFMLLTFPQDRARNIRPAGTDFRQGDTLAQAGTQIGPQHLSAFAAANIAELCVWRRPRIALLTNGDELRPPGSALEPGQIIASNEYTLSGLITACGGEVINLGTAKDDKEDIRARILSAKKADVIVPVGGASVGDYDYMRPVFAELGFESVFSKVAVRPGKPTWFSKKDECYVLGLPGNPASAFVCAHLFLKPLIRTLFGLPIESQTIRAKSLSALNSNGKRESFLRGEMRISEKGEAEVDLAPNQDSSLLSPFLKANVLVQRKVGAEAAEAGSLVECLRLCNALKH